MSLDPIRSLLLPNREHPYGDTLQNSLKKSGVIPLKCDAGWGFELHKNLDTIFDLRPDILHLQWPESLCRAEPGDDLDSLLGSIRGALSEIKKRGIYIAWTMHNLRPHHIFDLRFQTKLYEHFAACASGVIHHSHCGMRVARRGYVYAENAMHTVIRHGYFTEGTECDLSQNEARESLGLPRESAIYLFCGAFRKDKSIDVLVRAFRDIKPDAPQTLVMVGQPKEDASSLYPDIDLDHANILWPGRLPFEELSVYVKASDAFVGAHGDRHLTSAGPHLSQSYLKSQICLFSEYTNEVLGDTAFYFEKGNDAVENLKDRLASVTPEMLNRASDRLEQRREEYHWDVIGRNTRSFYEGLLDV